jgi:hypothetical protein
MKKYDNTLIGCGYALGIILALVMLFAFMIYFKK